MDRNCVLSSGLACTRLTAVLKEYSEEADDVTVIEAWPSSDELRILESPLRGAA